MLTRITDITDDWTSGLGGLKVGKYIDDTFTQNPVPIELSFYGIDSITPSFVNGAFLHVIDLYGEDFFPTFIKIKQIKPQVANVIKTSIQGYKGQETLFFNKLTTNRIYCAIDGSRKGLDFRYRLYEMTNNRGFHFYFNPENDTFTDRTWQEMDKADVCIGFLNKNAEIAIDDISQQLNYALQKGKPCILLCNRNVDTLYIPTTLRENIRIFYYTEDNYFQTIKEINKILQDNKKMQRLPSKKQDIKQENIIAGLLGITSLLFLLAIISEED